jgi:hypothetical protein
MACLRLGWWDRLAAYYARLDPRRGRLRAAPLARGAACGRRPRPYNRQSALSPQAFRGILLGGPVAGHLTGVAVISALMLGVLVPLDLRLLRRRVLGD